jgi:uncharacterized Zn-binding protein involved in type VI secretion
MPPAVRLADVCTGHGCFGSRPNGQGSPNVFINGKPAHRKGDLWNYHCCPPPCHASTACKGSPNVFTNNLDQERVGDPVCCGSKMATGSPNVFVN